MKTIKVFLVLALFSAVTYGQSQPEDNPNFHRTKHRVTIDGITYQVFSYKTGAYFTIRENPRTGRKYWQPLEMVKETPEQKKAKYKEMLKQNKQANIKDETETR